MASLKNILLSLIVLILAQPLLARANDCLNIVAYDPETRYLVDICLKLKIKTISVKGREFSKIEGTYKSLTSPIVGIDTTGVYTRMNYTISADLESRTELCRLIGKDEPSNQKRTLRFKRPRKHLFFKSESNSWVILRARVETISMITCK